jgi:hypothetical protein
MEVGEESQLNDANRRARHASSKKEQDFEAALVIQRGHIPKLPTRAPTRAS